MKSESSLYIFSNIPTSNLLFPYRKVSPITNGGDSRRVLWVGNLPTYKAPSIHFSADPVVVPIDSGENRSAGFLRGHGTEKKTRALLGDGPEG